MQSLSDSDVYIWDAMQIKGYIVYYFGITMFFLNLGADYLKYMQNFGTKLDSLLQIRIIIKEDSPIKSCNVHSPNWHDFLNFNFLREKFVCTTFNHFPDSHTTFPKRKTLKTDFPIKACNGTNDNLKSLLESFWSNVLVPWILKRWRILLSKSQCYLYKLKPGNKQPGKC